MSPTLTLAVFLLTAVAVVRAATVFGRCRCEEGQPD